MKHYGVEGEISGKRLQILKQRAESFSVPDPIDSIAQPSLHPLKSPSCYAFNLPAAMRVVRSAVRWEGGRCSID